MQGVVEPPCMSEQSPGTGAPRVVGVDSGDAEDVLGALQSETARTVLAALQDESATASAVADRTDLSLQTVQYHLDNLDGAGLVEVVDARTSEKGREMDVYAPSRRPVVVLAGDDGEGDDVQTLLARLLSGVGLLALVSLLVEELLGDGVAALFGATPAEETSFAADSTAGAAGGVPPGVAFFAGGLVVLLGAAAVWSLRRRDGSRGT